MQEMLDVLDEQTSQREAESLEKFYESVRRRAQGIDNAEGKQRIIVELYEKFFKTRLPTSGRDVSASSTPRSRSSTSSSTASSTS